MLACVDVAYADSSAVAVCVTFNTWGDAVSDDQNISRLDGISEYISGEFYRRELPCILAAIEPFKEIVKTVIVDGYVHLDDERPGLGLKLSEALANRVAIVGVAKTSFRGADSALRVFRGGSKRPLFVTAVGMPTDEAAKYIQLMHGRFRIPTLLKYVDRLARDECSNH